MSEENVEVVRRLYDTVNRYSGAKARDDQDAVATIWDTARVSLARDFVFREDPSWPGARTYRGLERCREVWDDYYEQFGEQTVKVEKFVPSGDQVSFSCAGGSGASQVARRWICRKATSTRFETAELLSGRSTSNEALPSKPPDCRSRGRTGEGAAQPSATHQAGVDQPHSIGIGGLDSLPIVTIRNPGPPCAPHV